MLPIARNPSCTCIDRCSWLAQSMPRHACLCCHSLHEVDAVYLFVPVCAHAVHPAVADPSFKSPDVQSGMVLPFQPMTMTFNDVHYFVNCPAEMVGQGLPNVSQKNGKHMLELLRGISGAFRPSILTCLMGVSGAGLSHFAACACTCCTIFCHDRAWTILVFHQKLGQRTRVCLVIDWHHLYVIIININFNDHTDGRHCAQPSCVHKYFNRHYVTDLASGNGTCAFWEPLKGSYLSCLSLQFAHVKRLVSS